MLKEFRDFAVKGNVIDMAVGIIVGAAFTTVVASLVKDVLMPPLGLLTGGVDFKDLFLVLKDGPGGAQKFLSLADAQAAKAVTLNFGLFFNSIIQFLIVAWAVFMLVKGLTSLKKPNPAAAPSTKDCLMCTMTIPVKAKRCPHCTTELPTA